MVTDGGSGAWKFWKISRVKEPSHTTGLKSIIGSTKSAGAARIATKSAPQTNGHTNGINGIMSPDGIAAKGTMAPSGGNEHLKRLAAEITRGVEAANLDEVTRMKLGAVAQELLNAVRLPTDQIMGVFAHMGIISAIRVLQSWKVFDTIPVTGSISLAELAEKVGAEEVLLSMFCVPSWISDICLNKSDC